jgi:hypothetical protein
LVLLACPNMNDDAVQSRPLGILAIWNDCAPGQEALFERWYRTEHLAERMGIPGFRIGRRFRRVTRRGPTYFTYYETDSPDVLFSDAYQARVNDPTPLTREVMDGTFANVSRTICRMVFGHGLMRGSHAVTASSDAPDALERLGRRLASDPDVARIGVWLADTRSEGTLNAEQAIRGEDARVAASLLVETFEAADAVRIAEAVWAETDETPGVYALICDLHA